MELSAIKRLIEECEQHPCAAPNVDLVAYARAELNAWNTSVVRDVGAAFLDAQLLGTGFIQITRLDPTSVAIAAKAAT